ncbi:MAG: diaminopimelate decarboxylase [Spirochaetaceae bacterium]|jgi:diaminopimelate decarboxylase|nr:diaminopimelate decarboxylase [Spirochaetaceae bacterium]
MTDRIHLSTEQARGLIEKYGSPLYVYDEGILRRRCREVRALSAYPCFRVNYSAKANTNIELLKIIRTEGLQVDAMSPGEILAEEAAGFAPEEIFFVPNNVSLEEMRFAADRGIMVSVDSLSQLEQYGGSGLPRRIAFRLNPGIGAGHGAKVITGGKSKFGIERNQVGRVREIAARFGLRIVGINQHIGSLFLKDEDYLAAAEVLFETARKFPELEFVDLGGGLGVPYRNEPRLDMEALGARLSGLITDFTGAYPRENIGVVVEPGRYITAECGVLLGTVHSVKENYGETYVGTDIGFNVLMRPVLYDSWHDIRFFSSPEGGGDLRKITVTGNICESGDILARDRELPLPRPGDIIGVENAGAYGYSMTSNYNSRLRPAEVLIDRAGGDRLIRRRDTYAELLRPPAP